MSKRIVLLSVIRPPDKDCNSMNAVRPLAPLGTTLVIAIVPDAVVVPV